MCSAAAIALLMFVPGTAEAQRQSKTDDAAFSDQKLKGIMERIEAHSDAFEDKFEAALDKSSLDGTGLEDRLNRWADMLEDELDNMAEDYKERDSDEFVEHLENAMILATGVNRAMLRHDLGPMADAQWKAVRDDVNTVATVFRRPVLPNVTAVTLVPVNDDLLTKTDVQHVMERLESSTDRFKEKFDQAMNARVATKTNREEMFTNLADDLEDVSDELIVCVRRIQGINGVRWTSGPESDRQPDGVCSDPVPAAHWKDNP
jgi:hypothetical protein